MGGTDMSIAVYFHPTAMSARQYDDLMSKLVAEGNGHPEGRLHHSTFGPDEALMVYDIWESQEAFDRFGQILMPALQQAGIDPGQPDIMPIHSVVD
jgi:hypothetical protein